MPGLIDRVKERRIGQWILAYLAVAVPIWSVVEVLGDRWGLTPGAGRALDVVLMVGLLVAAVLGWYHGEKGRQRVNAPEAVLLLGLVGAGVGGVLLWGPLKDRQPTDSVEAVRSNTLAILPFDNRSADGSEGAAFFAEGLHDELLLRMSKLDGLEVIGRTSVARYAGEDRPPNRDIAADLGARVLLEGSVIQSGDRLRMNVQLVDGSSGVQIFADQWDEPYSVQSALDMLSDVASRIVGVLESPLTPGEATWLAELPTESPDAFTAFLEGRTLSRYGGSLEEALEALQRAVRLDPSFAQAWAAMIWPLEMSARRGGPEAGRWHALAQEAVDSATALAPDAPETLYARAMIVYFAERDYGEASRILRLMQARWPGDVDALLLAGTLSKRQGRFQECVQAHERVLMLDPANVNAYIELAICNKWLGRGAEAATAQERAIALDPDNLALYNERFGTEITPKGDTAGARRYMESVRDRVPIPAAWETAIRFIAGDFEALLAEAHTRGEGAHTANEYLATMYRLAGWADSARIAGQSLAAALRSREVLPAAEPTHRASLARALILAEDYEGAAAALQQAEALLEEYPDAYGEYSISYYWALFHLAQGEEDEAVRRLDEFWARLHDPSPAWAAISPLWTPLRDHPGFIELLARYGVAIQ